MYTLSMPVSQLRTKMRQEFERHRYVNQLRTVDVHIRRLRLAIGEPDLVRTVRSAGYALDAEGVA